jgi:cytochrome c553
MKLLTALSRSRPALLAAALLASSAALAATPVPAFKADLARGQQLAATCLADGTRGSPANPILQGQHPEYIAKQLQEFKSGKRRNAIMQGMAAALSTEDMKHIAAFYANKPTPKGFAGNKETVALGEAIWRGGIKARGVPACAGCHGPAGSGIPAQFPRIAGQHVAYTEAQMNAFRLGERANNAQMMAIAGKMNEREIKAVSDFAAGLR